MIAVILFLIFNLLNLKTGILDQVQCGRAFLNPPSANVFSKINRSVSTLQCSGIGLLACLAGA